MASALLSFPAPRRAPIRLGSKRAGTPGKPKPGEIAVDIDRKNRILGNPFILRDPNDKAARADVIERLPSSIAPTLLATVPWPRQPKPSPSA